MGSKRKRDALNARQALFVREYLKDLNATQAAERAGYRHPNVQGPRLLVNVCVAAEIAKGKAKTAERLEITADDIRRELAKCGFSNMADYMKAGPDFSQLTRDQAAALSEVTVEDYVDGRGEDARAVKRVKFKLVDKRASLMDLAKLCGFVKERHEHTGKDGGPIETKAVPVDYTKCTDEELELMRRIALKSTAANGAGPHGDRAGAATPPLAS